MAKYFVYDEEYDTYDDAWEAAEESFWESNDFENFWQQEVDGREVLEELARLGSPLYENLLDAICDQVGQSIMEVEDDEDEEEEEEY